ncbi:MAG: L,D-transpeptidase family protein [Pseudomonadota bacterium]
MSTAKAIDSARARASELGIDLAGDWLWVDGDSQTLTLFQGEEPVRRYSVSTAHRGFGCFDGSLQTPTGWHRVSDKIGSDEVAGRVFKGRRPQPEVVAISYRQASTGRDCITSRILWLDGLEPGHNRGDGVDSHSRYIYIHGTHEEGLIGQPASVGCVRMKNADIIELYERVAEDTPVCIRGE